MYHGRERTNRCVGGRVDRSMAEDWSDQSEEALALEGAPHQQAAPTVEEDEDAFWKMQHEIFAERQKQEEERAKLKAQGLLFDEEEAPLITPSADVFGNAGLLGEPGAGTKGGAGGLIRRGAGELDTVGETGVGCGLEVDWVSGVDAKRGTKCLC